MVSPLTQKNMRIGVSGHRDIREIVPVQAGIQQALKELAALYSPERWVFYSSLAEGSDCLVAQEILKYPLEKFIVPLPLPVEIYLDDFSSAPGRDLFQILLHRADEVIECEPREDKASAYLASGEYIVNHSDIFIAIWDGRPARGKGGTGDIVNLVRQQGKPLIWICSGPRLSDITPDVQETCFPGTIVFERF